VAHLIEVAFRGNRKEFFSWDGETPPPLKAGVIVEADRGEDFGRVHATGELAEVRCRGCAHGCGTAPPPRRALRLATRDDERADRDLGEENERARRRAMERVKAHGLVMKLTDAEWQWDRKKLTLFFTAERRVDFRNLVRDLAALFKTRIELKQIGVRDEAKRLGGVGRCGREYCSASWLPELRPVNLGVAKDQKLSLNPQQISGACGRLMCCLRYEHEFYVQSRRKFPKEGKILLTSRGEEKVMACDIFHERVTLRTAEGDTRVLTLAELRNEVEGFDTSAAQVADATITTAVAVTLEASTVAMLDTAEYETVILETPAFARTVAAERVPTVAADSTAEVSVALSPARDVPAHDVSVGDPQAGEVPTGEMPRESPEAIAYAAPEAVAPQLATPEDAPRRKRRRGRRGGRRLRAAEERRREEGGDEAADELDEDAEDASAD
jgi:cell fate regulator YaaT (PSP1 superfamily)